MREEVKGKQEVRRKEVKTVKKYKLHEINEKEDDNNKTRNNVQRILHKTTTRKTTQRREKVKMDKSD